MSRNISFSRLDNCLSGETVHVGSISPVFLSKEIAYQLGVSIYTVNNHRKNILSKLDANNIMEAIHIVGI